MSLPVAGTLDILVPAAQYEGSLTDDSKAAYEALVWHDSRPKPTWEQISSTTSSVSQLATAASAAAVSACESIIGQIAPDAAHLVAFQNGYATVQATGQAPTTEPLKSAFAAQAAAFGETPENFVELVISLGAVSIQLSAALKKVQDAARDAKVVSDLSAALGDFQNTITGLVGAIVQAGVTIVAPPPIAIPGIDLPA